MMKAIVSVMLLWTMLAAGCGGTTLTGPSASLHDRTGYEDRAELLTADRAFAAEILDLDPERISREEVEGILSRGPAPRVILLNGSLPLVTMESVSRFLMRMGYPEGSLRSPVDGSYAASSFQGSARLASKATPQTSTTTPSPIQSLRGRVRGRMGLIFPYRRAGMRARASAPRAASRKTAHARPLYCSS